jgi:Protein of unknown function (DUF2948)
VGEVLKLKAAEIEDVTILSAAVQGSITSPGEMGFNGRSRIFTLTISRFMWEQYADGSTSGNRVRCGLYIGDVLRAKKMSFPADDDTVGMELLSLTTTTGEDGMAHLQLDFAGGSSIQLEVECVNLTLTDVGDPWQTDKIPHYEEGTGEA